ncbi:MAG TPA: hypothetical protein VJ983_08110 [candidate division Zixibacteria bacterium]|nr:hypothetical protein [candidate division Zixibacteria bacterium]
MKRILTVSLSIAALAAALTAIGCSTQNGPTAPQQSADAVLKSGSADFGNGSQTKPSYETTVTGEVVKLDMKNEVLAIGKDAQHVIVTMETKAALLPATRQVPFKFSFLRVGTQITVRGYSKKDAVVAQLIEVALDKPTTEATPFAF